MADKLSSGDTNLRKVARQRLVGAITIVLLVVVFLPMVIDDEPRMLSEDILIVIPATPEILDRPLSSNKQDYSVAKKLPHVARDPENGGLNTTDEKINAKSEDSSQALAKFTVQVGAFFDDDAAKMLVLELRKERLPVYVEVTEKGNKKRTRVRLGPYPNKEAANLAIKAVKELKLDIDEPVMLKMPR